jgi:hypothetical protein
MHARRTPGLVVAALVVASSALRFAAATRYDAPWIAPDEAIYGVLGRSFWETGHLSVLGAHTAFYGLYPLVPGLPVALLGPATGVTATQALQAVVMSSTAAVAYGWARQVTTAWWAVGAAALTAALPALAYSGLLMTEAVFLPLATLSLWLLARALVEPTLGRQAAAGGLVALTSLVRIQGLVFVGVMVVAVLVAALLARDASLVRRFAPTFAAVAALAVIALVAAISKGGGSELLGAYSSTATSGYDATSALRWIVRHVADGYLLVVGVPLLALVVLLADAVRGRERDPDVRALLAVATSAFALVVVQVGVFASRFVERLAERDLVTIAPPLFVVLVLWAGRGLRRPQPLTSIAAVAIAAPVLLLPVKELVTPAATPDAFMLVPFVRLAEHASETTVELVFAGLAAAFVALAVFLPRRAAPLLVALVGATLVATSAFASAEVASRSRTDRETTFGGSRPDWVDAATDGDVVYLYDGDPDWTGLWQHVFWNERIVRVAAPPGELLGPVPGPELVVAPSADGALRDDGGEALTAMQVVAPANVRFVGEQLETIAQGEDRPGLTLWRTDPSPRVDTWTVGLRPNGDIVEPVRVSVFACGPGRLELTLLGKQGLPVRLSANGRLVRTVRLPPDTVWRGAVRAPGDADGRGRCVFEIASDGLVGSTRIDYVRA